MRSIIALFVFLASSAFAHELSFTNYLKVQENLAADQFAPALVAHKAICAKELDHKLKDYPGCKTTFKDIQVLRESFKKLSEIYLEHGNKKELKGLTKATCPMAEAKWVQRNGGLKNPYYGKSMLDCGEKI